jgi:hypothetical protein
MLLPVLILEELLNAWLLSNKVRDQLLMLVEFSIKVGIKMDGNLTGRNLQIMMTKQVLSKILNSELWFGISINLPNNNANQGRMRMGSLPGQRKT